MRALDHERLAELFEELSGLDRQQQEELLDRHGVDRQTREELESLLYHEDRLPGILRTDGMPFRERNETVSLPGRIGDYEILEKLGDGGMGVVYRARQPEPLGRDVAIKLIRPGLETEQVVSRFDAERKVLALLDHPGIARVIDAGATGDGRPYFVMEYVEGEPITAFCDKHRLGIRERLGLFMQLCDAVQHAHRNAVIHRDLKPSNVLVSIQDGKPVPKVIDFGIAKAMDRRLTRRTLYTEIGQFVGTPEYMSPEQTTVGNNTVDTRTDVYSLGAILYELLAGLQLFDPAGFRITDLEEIRRQIREQEPVKPSTRLARLGEAVTRIAERRRTDAGSLARRLRGDLDWIVLKALEKEPDQRYGSPDELAADIRRHLDDEPVLAGPPTLVYRTGKFVRKHRAGVVTSGMAIAVLAAFALTMTIQTLRLTKERDRANREAATAEHVSGFLVDLFDVSDLSAMTPHRGIRPEEILDRGWEKVERELGNRPELQVRLQAAMGRMYYGMGRAGRAGPALEQARADFVETYGPEHPRTLEVMHHLTHVLRYEGSYSEAERLGRITLDVRRRVLGEDHPDTLRSMQTLGYTLVQAGRYEQAREILRPALIAMRRVLGRDHRETLAGACVLAGALNGSGAYDDAEALLTDTLEKSRRALGDRDPWTAMTLYSLGATAAHRGDRETALAYLRQVAERGFASGAVTDPLLESWFRKDPDFEELASRFRMNNTWARNVASARAAVLDELGRHDEAEPLYVEVLDGWRRAGHMDHEDARQTLYRLGEMYVRQGRYEDADPLLREFLSGADKVPEDEALAHLVLAQCQLADGDSAAASSSMERATAVLDGTGGRSTALGLYTRAARSAILGDRDTALRSLRNAVAAGLNPRFMVELDLSWTEFRDDPELQGIFAELLETRQEQDARAIP
jgi:non-specific serine/threonine protein kinase/serine/threonine-protein kinase